MLAGDEARRLDAALAAAAKLEGRGELADIRARLRRGDRLRGAGAVKGGDPGEIGGWLAVRLLGEEGDHEGQEAQRVPGEFR